MVSSGGEEEKMDKKIDVRGNDKTMNHKAGVRLQRTCIRISTVPFAKQPSVTSGQLIYLPLSFKGIVQPKMFLLSFTHPHVVSNLSLFCEAQKEKKKEGCFLCSYVFIQTLGNLLCLGTVEWVKTCLNVLWNSRGWFPSQNILFRSAIATGQGFTVTAGHVVAWGCNTWPVPIGFEKNVLFSSGQAIRWHQGSSL